MINWLGAVAIVIAIFLGRFYTFLEEYESAYQASRPSNVIDEVMPLFNDADTDAIYDMMSVKPVINEFETEENVKNYMKELIAGKEFKYFESPESTSDIPEFFVTADGYSVAKISLSAVPGESFGYDFPVWDISSFDFYTDAQYSVRLEKPDNYSFTINGKEVPAEYAYEKNIEIEDRQYFERYLEKTESEFPSLEKYYVEGFYEKPEVSALGFDGNQAECIFDESRGMINVPFMTSDEYDEIVAYATKAVTDYAFYVSGDVEASALDKYFPKGDELLKMIKHGTSQKWFMPHSKTFMDNVTVNEFIMFNPDCVYVGLTMDQHFISGRTDTVIPTNGNFCYVRIGDKWKVCGIKF